MSSKRTTIAVLLAAALVAAGIGVSYARGTGSAGFDCRCGEGPKAEGPRWGDCAGPCGDAPPTADCGGPCADRPPRGDCRGPGGCGSGHEGKGDGLTVGRERHRHGGLGWRAEGVDLTAQETEALVAFRLRRANPNLRVGKVTDAGKAFEVEVVTTKAGDLVERFWVDKATGRLADEPAPRE